MTAAEKTRGCSTTTNNTVLRAEQGIRPLETDKRREKVELAL